MNSVDSLVFDSLRELELPIPEDVNTVESIDRVLFFNLCLECLKRLDSSNTDAIQPVTSDKDIGHAECMQLADELTYVGYSAEVSFHTFLYPEPSDVIRVLSWLASTLLCLKDETKKKVVNRSLVESERILQSIRQWKETPPPVSSPRPSLASDLLQSEEYKLIHERLRYQWRDIPRIRVAAMIDNSDSISFRRIKLSSALSENAAVSEEVASLQMDLLRLNRVFYHRVRKVKGINGKLDALKRNVDELRKMIEFTETAIFQKNAILDIISDIDVYLTRIHDNCDAISAERSKEEYIFKQKREEVTHVIDELDHQKQLLWEESQSLLGHVQKSRQEIERITAVVGERKQEKEELDTMLRLMPKQAFRDVYLDRLNTLSTRKTTQNEEIGKVTREIVAMNEEIKEVAEKIVKEEKTIEMEMKELYGNEVEGSTLFNVYSQMKRLFHSLIMVLVRIIETDDSLTTINLQIRKIDVAVICKNYEYMLRDVEKIRKENEVLMARIERIEAW
ncbi:hypothetical protein WA588_002311 [Blastocystis sp. NMH]